MFTAAIGICAAIVLLWIKLPLVTRLKMYGHPFLLDLSVSFGILIVFSGTGDGLMAATIAGLFMSVLITWTRKWYGYYEYDKETQEYFYVVGLFNLTDKIIAEKRRKLGDQLIDETFNT
jgi:biopolymer transport protein ExbB/TolQ